MFPELALPPFEIRWRPAPQKKGSLQIWDIIRKKYVLLTPEEWVRQHFLHYLIQHLQYPPTSIALETEVPYFQSKKRADLVVYQLSTGKQLMVVECKAAHIALSESTMQQAALYNSQLRCPFVVITNGLEIHTWHVSQKGINPTELPHFSVLNNAL